MADFLISEIYGILSDRGIARSQRTFSKWKRIVRLPLWASQCALVDAELLVGCALLRAAHPTKALGFADVVRFTVSHRARIEMVLSGVPRIKPQLMGEYSWQQAAELISQFSECGICPSDDTIARWCKKLGINFSRPMPVSASTVYRLIDQADREAQARIARGKRLANSKRMKAA